ncbi:glycosyltransferase [candidate division KSB1 bacterium]|nr:glycosyltransferase [candidate division KSB1 bacterium]
MKICLIADAANSHTQKWAAFFAPENEVSIISFRPAKIPNVKVYDIIPSIPVDIKPSFSTMATIKKFGYLFCVKQVKKFLKQIQPDIVNAHYASSYGMLGALSGFHPLIISVWGSDIFDFPRQSWIREQIIKHNLKKANYIVALSHTLSQETKLYTNKKITLVPFGVDINRFKPEDKNTKNGITIGIVKALEEKYGVTYLVKAFIKVTKLHQNTKLLVVGQGSQETQMKKMCRDAGITKKVTFIGYVQNDRVPKLLNQMDIFVMPSILHSETLGVAALEASACGIPIVASRIGGVHEAVLDDSTGFLVEPKNVDQLVQKLDILIKDDALRQEMGKRGRKHVVENYNWEKNAAKMLHLYKEILEKFPNKDN